MPGDVGERAGTMGGVFDREHQRGGTDDANPSLRYLAADLVEAGSNS